MFYGGESSSFWGGSEPPSGVAPNEFGNPMGAGGALDAVDKLTVKIQFGQYNFGGSCQEPGRMDAHGTVTVSKQLVRRQVQCDGFLYCLCRTGLQGGFMQGVFHMALPFGMLWGKESG